MMRLTTTFKKKDDQFSPFVCFFFCSCFFINYEKNNKKTIECYGFTPCYKDLCLNDKVIWNNGKKSEIEIDCLQGRGGPCGTGEFLFLNTRLAYVFVSCPFI